MRITIIGCGWLGSALAAQWRPRHRLVVTTTRPERVEQLAPLAEAVHVLRGDDRAALARALEHAEVAVVTVAPTGTRQVDAEAYAATYLGCCRQLVDLLPDCPGLRQVIYTSSCGVYGDAGGGWIDETTPPSPRDGQGEVLLAAEQLLLNGADAAGYPDREPPAVAVLRLGALHGPGREIGPRLAALAGTRRPGSGATQTNWIHRTDALAAIEAVLEHRFSGILNVVDGRPATLRQVADAVCRERALAPVAWDDAAQSPGRRIRSERLRQLGVELRFASVLEHLWPGHPPAGDAEPSSQP